MNLVELLFTSIHDLFGVPAVLGFERKKSRRRVMQWLRKLNPVQKEVLRSVLHEAKASKRRIVEWRIERAECSSFDTQCALLLTTGAVTLSKYSPPGIKRYRLEPWLYDYLSKHPELLDMGDESGDGAPPHDATLPEIAVRDGREALQTT